MAVSWAFPFLLSAQGVPDVLPDESEFRRVAGQNIQPFYEGWQRMPDGHIAMWFGYLNRNYKELGDVPIGPDNRFDWQADLGQPTHFYPRRRLFVFKVDLPSDWPADKHLVWTVNYHGKPAAANGWLQPEWEVDDGVIQMNIGPGGAPPENPRNQPPAIRVRADTTVSVGSPLKLFATATDDGIPKPRVRNPSATTPAATDQRMPLPPAATPPPRAQLGLRIHWILYRAPDGGGEVVFDQDSNAPVVGAASSELTNAATFTAPGTYWLRAIASDGTLETPYDLKVSVIGTR
ncbi:MAG: hypothetical protein C5B51_15385 [Terriglobia bacterium]|nr:MAG: hypothetical protein C5B51_15385 [Terriglobia bacterium]